MQYRNGQRVKVTGGLYVGRQGTVEDKYVDVGTYINVRLDGDLSCSGVDREHLAPRHPTPRFVEVGIDRPHKTLADVEDGEYDAALEPENPRLGVVRRGNAVFQVCVNGREIRNLHPPSAWLLPDRREPTYGDVPVGCWTMWGKALVRRMTARWEYASGANLNVNVSVPLQSPVWRLEVGDE